MIIGLNSHRAAKGGLDREKMRYIKRLQAYLNRLDYDAGKPDGYFGLKTEAAVKEMQEDFQQYRPS